MQKYSYREMLQECNRELSMRAHVYPQRVAARKMSQQQADKQIGIMAAVVELLTGLADAEKAQEAAAEPSFLDL